MVKTAVEKASLAVVGKAKKEGKPITKQSNISKVDIRFCIFAELTVDR